MVGVRVVAALAASLLCSVAAAKQDRHAGYYYPIPSTSEVYTSRAVVGDVNARRQVILHANARLHGNIETACLEIERHAFFQGQTRMTRPQATSRRAQPSQPKPAATAKPGPAPAPPSV